MRAWPRSRAGLLVLSLALPFAACTQQSRPAQPNVLLVVVDTLRADHLGSYGYARPTSPNLDALAARGVRFARAYTTSSWTAPGVTSILTGLYPAAHGVEKANSVLGDDVPLMSEAFSRAGYATAAMAANPAFVSPRMGIGRGFESFELLQGPAAGIDDPLKVIPTDPELRSWVQVADAQQVTDAALAWLTGDRRGDRPYFLFLHYIDPHPDYFPPREFAARFGVAVDDPLAGVAQRQLLRTFIAPPAAQLATLVSLYDAEIAYLDVHLGRLFETIERSDRPTLIVVTADHGEEFGDHGGLMHGLTLFEEQLHVPLIMAGAGLGRGIEVPSPVSLARLWRTIGEITGVAASPSSGASFASFLGGRGEPDVLFADLDNSDQPRQAHRAVVDGDWKMIEKRNGERMLFDLASDAGEKSDLISADGLRVESMASALARHASLSAELRVESAPATVALSPEDRARMRALGYDH